MARDSEVLNAQEAADLLGAHVETVRRLARRGEIPSFKLGKDWRFRREVLVQWADTHHLRRMPPPVLVVDDDEDVRDVVSRTLADGGYTCRVASNGAEALTLVSQETPALILLDLSMEPMNGPKFLRELRKTHPDIPVAVITGYPDGELMMEAAQFGPVMLLRKPVAEDELLRSVRIVLGGSRN